MKVAQPLPIGFVSSFFGNFRLWLCQDYLVEPLCSNRLVLFKQKRSCLIEVFKSKFLR